MAASAATTTQASPPLRRELLTGLGGYTAPASPLEARLAELWSEATGMDRIGTHDDYFALGGSSLQAARIFSQITAEFGVTLPLATLYDAPTVGALAREIARRLDTPAPAMSGAVRELRGRLVAIQPGGDRPPLYIVPGVGGGVVGLAYLARALGPEQPVYAFESRGLNEGETPLEDLQEIAAEYLRDLREFQPEGPWQLFGICWGGMVVFEMARQLAARGAAPGPVLMLDPPPFGDGLPAPRRSRALAVPRFVGSRLRLYWEEMRAMQGAQRWRFLRERLRLAADIVRQRDLFRGDDSELRRRLVREANLVAARRYRPASPDFRVSLMFTDSRPDGRSRTGRQRWVELLGGDEPPASVPGRDTGDAISPASAHHIAAALRPRLG